MKSKTVNLIIPSCLLTFFIVGCQKNIHHMPKVSSSEVVMEHSGHNGKMIMIHNQWVMAVPPVSENYKVSISPDTQLTK